MYKRILELPTAPQESLFLWGPRQVGKTQLLKTLYPHAFWIQLLHNEEYLKYSKEPQRLREIIRIQKPSLVVIDEVQKVPSLLDEVHFLIEEYRSVFVLCGSSARKLKRGHANLLGGRALRHELSGLTARELGPEFDLKKMLNNGYLPSIYNHPSANQKQEAYCADYLKEEIMSEGLLRKLPPFSRFLELAALSDTEQISYESFARDVGVSAPTIASYFDILQDTLIGSYLEPFAGRPKRKIKKAPKFYFFDVGIVNYLARRSKLEQGSELWGKAFENWVHHELKNYISYNKINTKMSYWGLSSHAAEVDFIIGDMHVAIEAKSSLKIQSDHLKNLRELKKEFPQIKNRIVVSGENTSRLSEDGIFILSTKDFIQKLWDGELLE